MDENGGIGSNNASCLISVSIVHVFSPSMTSYCSQTHILIYRRIFTSFQSLLASCVAVLLLCVGFNLFIWLPSDSFQLPTEAATAGAISAEHTTSSQLTTASPEATISGIYNPQYIMCTSDNFVI